MTATIDRRGFMAAVGGTVATGAAGAAPGQHTIRVRATDKTGRTQTSVVHATGSDGAAGHHTVRLSVA